MNKQPLLNTYINNVTMDETLNEISRLVDVKQKSYVVAINVDVVMKIEKDEYLKKITDEADLTLVGGKPLVWIAKWHKHPVKAKISGSDLVPDLCKVAHEKGYSIFIIGGKEGIAEQAKQNINKQTTIFYIV